MNGDWYEEPTPEPIVFPYPREMGVLDEPFVFDESVVVVVPDNPTASELFLARFLTAELSDRFQIALRVLRRSEIPEGRRFVLMGSVANYLVRARCGRQELDVTATDPGPEGYLLDVTPDACLVAGSDDRGAFYGLQTLRQLIMRHDDEVFAPGAHVRDLPWKPFRGLRMYLPGQESLPAFKRFLRDFAAPCKYNTLILETNAAMRFERRPELNAGWLELARNMNATRRSRPEGPGRQFQDSVHHDTGDFGVVEKEEVADLVDFARQHGFDVIPEIPSLTHAYYLLTRHREFAEVRDAEWPDTYCPCVDEVYDLLFDVIDEYLEVMDPEMVHIGHDEWRMPMDVCPRCKGRDYGELFARDVSRIYEHLKAQGVRVAMWGDHLLEAVRGRAFREKTTTSGYVFRMPGALTPEQVVELIPKDILIFNWFWNEASRENAEANEIQLAEWGFQQVFGNFATAILDQDYGRRSAGESILGGAPSAWTAASPHNLGKDLVTSFAGCACLLWSDSWPSSREMLRTAQALMPAFRRAITGVTPPSEEGDAIVKVDIDAARNATPGEVGLEDWGGLRRGEVAAEAKRFRLTEADEPGRFAVVVGVEGEDGTTLPLESPAVPVGEDASGLLFLHACARPAGAPMSHFMIYNFEDCGDLLGWYEVTYEDGLVLSVPVRYGVNVLEWTWGRDGEMSRTCFKADPTPCGPEDGPAASFFAFEWVNPRYGKAIREVRLKGSRGFVDAHGQPIASNALMLVALSLVRKRPGAVSEHGKEDV